MRALITAIVMLFGSLSFAFEGPAGQTIHLRGISHYEHCDVKLTFSADGKKVTRIDVNGVFSRYSHLLNKYYNPRESKSFRTAGLPIHKLEGFTKGYNPIPYGEVIGGVYEHDRQAKLYTFNGRLSSVELAYDELLSNAIFRCDGLEGVD